MVGTGENQERMGYAQSNDILYMCERTKYTIKKKVNQGHLPVDGKAGSWIGSASWASTAHSCASEVEHCAALDSLNPNLSSSLTCWGRLCVDALLSSLAAVGLPRCHSVIWTGTEKAPDCS